MASILVKQFDKPDEIRTLPKTTVELVRFGNKTIMKATFQPGWKWSECIKPTVGTTSCEVPHLNYILSGRIQVKMDDGSEKELHAGDIAEISPGHDAWVVGNEPCIALDFTGGDIYAKSLEDN